MIQNNEKPMATTEASEYSYHLEDGASCYNQLDQQWQTILDQYIKKRKGEFSERYCKSIKHYCSEFLFSLKNDGVFTETDISYRHIVRFIDEQSLLRTQFPCPLQAQHALHGSITFPASCTNSVSIPALFNASKTLFIKIAVLPSFLALLLIKVCLILGF